MVKPILKGLTVLGDSSDSVSDLSATRVLRGPSGPVVVLALQKWLILIFSKTT